MPDPIPPKASEMSAADKAEVQRLLWWAKHHNDGRNYEAAQSTHREIDKIFAKYESAKS